MAATKFDPALSAGAKHTAKVHLGNLIESMSKLSFNDLQDVVKDLEFCGHPYLANGLYRNFVNNSLDNDTSAVESDD